MNESINSIQEQEKSPCVDIDHLPPFFAMDDSNEGKEEKEEDNTDQKSISSDRTFPSEHASYGGSSEKKPKWWRRLAGRRGTKVQRAAMERNEHHMVPKAPYGTYLNFNLPSEKQPEIWLEIGFGQGANLLANAKRNPHRFYLGAEMHQPGVGHILLQMEQQQQENLQQQNNSIMNSRLKMSSDEEINYDLFGTNHADFTQSATSKSYKLYSNLRVYPGDGTKLIRSLPTHSMTSIMITFPDPFANFNQQKWRIVQRHTLQEIQRVLKPDGGQFYLATDVEEYHNWTHQLIQKEADQQLLSSSCVQWKEVQPTPPRSEWLPIVSPYEQKGLNEGRSTWLQCWELGPTHPS